MQPKKCLFFSLPGKKNCMFVAPVPPYPSQGARQIISGYLSNPSAVYTIKQILYLPAPTQPTAISTPSMS